MREDFRIHPYGYEPYALLAELSIRKIDTRSSVLWTAAARRLKQVEPIAGYNSRRHCAF